MSGAEKRPLLIDTDPGVDDAVTLLAARAAPGFDLIGVSVVNGNVELDRGVENALRVLAFAGRADVPVHRGASKPLLRDAMRGKFHGTKGLGPLALPEAPAPARQEHAVDMLARHLRAGLSGAAPKPCVCAIGPLTNIALVLAKEPELARGFDTLAIMGGGFAVGGNRTPTAEFNFLADPHAAKIVFASGAPIVLAPLDVTHKALATPGRMARLRARGGAFAAAVADLLTFFDRKDPARYGDFGAPVHDPTTLAWLLRPDLFRVEAWPVEICVEEGPAFGQSVADRWGATGRAPNARVLTDVDVDGFFDLLGDLLAT